MCCYIYSKIQKKKKKILIIKWTLNFKWNKKDLLNINKVFQKTENFKMSLQVEPEQLFMISLKMLL